MTKQEEIYWHIATLLIPVAKQKMSGFEASSKILNYLDSKGGAIKVDKPLPSGEGCLRASDYKDRIRQAGFTAVEPLIEKGAENG